MTFRSNLRRLTTTLVAAMLMILTASLAGAFCPEIHYVNLADKSVEIGFSMGEDEVNVDNFGGYRIWMKEVWQDADLKLVREYVWGESDTTAAGYWPFPPWYEMPIRTYRDFELQNAFPYEFSVTAFEAGVEDTNFVCLAENRTGVVYPRTGISTRLKDIQCIPNPYRMSADWEYGGQRRVTFVGLPGAATIRIYTTSASLVRTLRHEDPDSDLEFWNLKNSDGEDVAAGVYIWAVEADNIGSIDGKIMIIK